MPSLKVLATSRAPLRVAASASTPCRRSTLPAGRRRPRGRLARGEALRRARAGGQAELRARPTTTSRRSPRSAAARGHPARDRARGRAREADDAAADPRRGSARSGSICSWRAATAERQDSLRDAIEWSYNLLDDSARRSSRASASSSAAARSRRAEAVAGEALGLEFGEVLDGVAALVDNGLVRQGESADGEPRFRMLETIREYALERLSGARRARGRRARRHLERYVELAETAEPELHARGQARLARAARRGERQHPRRARLVVRVRPGRARPAARGRARPLLEHPRADDRGPALAGRGARRRGRRRPGRARRRRTSRPASRRSARATTRRRSRSSSAASSSRGRPATSRLEALALQQIGWLVMTGGKYEEAHGERARELAEQSARAGARRSATSSSSRAR